MLWRWRPRLAVCGAALVNMPQMGKHSFVLLQANTPTIRSDLKQQHLALYRPLRATEVAPPYEASQRVGLITSLLPTSVYG